MNQIETIVFESTDTFNRLKNASAAFNTRVKAVVFNTAPPYLDSGKIVIRTERGLQRLGRQRERLRRVVLLVPR